ncbi:unnamed protein product [Mycena citricolor]|uniref:F-box domain-containing protein n=1 Tax=Mycena citricolor TaxID=2018698 RepID=A0AAD2HL86_9AGAR|nr:unnamed protein product [Mycena citricolor]
MLLPPELTDQIIQLLDSPSDLLTCSLVCRTWVPASRGSHPTLGTLALKGDDFPGYIALVGSPHQTLTGAVRSLHLSSCNAPEIETLVRAARFPNVRHVGLRACQGPTDGWSWDLAPFEMATSLDLNALEFMTIRSYLELLKLFPALATLHLKSILLIELLKHNGEEDIVPPFRLELDELVLDFLPNIHWARWLAAPGTTVNTRAVTVRTADYNKSGGYVHLMQYLSKLDGHLQFLSLVSNLPAAITIFPSSALRSLHIGATIFVGYATGETLADGQISGIRTGPRVISMLESMDEAPLEILCLGVKIIFDYPSLESRVSGTTTVAKLMQTIRESRFIRRLRRLEIRGVWHSEWMRVEFEQRLRQEKIDPDIERLLVFVSDDIEWPQS